MNDLPRNTDEITALPLEQAAELRVEYDRLELSLCGLKRLSDELAASLALHDGPLYLDGLEEISVSVARALAKHQDHLTLDGLTSISDDVARELNEHSHLLSLHGVVELPINAVMAWRDCELVELRRPAIELLEDTNKLTCVNEEMVELFNDVFPYPDTIELNGLTAVSWVIAKVNSDLSLNGLVALDAEQAKILSNIRYELTLDGLATLSDKAAKWLARHRGDLTLDGLATLSDEAAECLARHRGSYISLKGLANLSDAAAKSLAQYKGTLLFGDRIEMSPEAAAEFRTNPRIRLPKEFKG